MNPELTILVPAFDDLANLEANLPAMAQQAADATQDYELLVVDDGSSDRTAEVIGQLSRRDKRIRLVSHPCNLGPGAGIPTGLFWARGEWLMFLPADLACEPEEIGRLWRQHDGVDLVIGLRSDRRDYSLWRRALSRSYIALVRALSGSRVRQFNYILLVRRRVFDKLPLRSRGVFVTAEIILRVQGAGLDLAELPMRYLPRSRGKAAGASPRALLRCGLELGRFFAIERWIGFS